MRIRVLFISPFDAQPAFRLLAAIITQLVREGKVCAGESINRSPQRQRARRALEHSLCSQRLCGSPRRGFGRHNPTAPDIVQQLLQL